MIWEIVGLIHLLKGWKRIPDAPPSEYSCWYVHKDRHHRFTNEEINKMRDRLKRLEPGAYYAVFPEEQPWSPQSRR